MATTTQRSTSERIASNWNTLRTSKSWQRNIRFLISYIVLGIGAVFMLFPMLWMLSASFKPVWQIFSDPPIWIPQEWEAVRAGNTNRLFNLWQLDDNGQTQKVITIGTRRYTTIIDSTRLQNLQSVPADQLGEATATSVGDVVLNVRPWTVDGQTKDVIALSKDGNNFVIAEVANVQNAVARYPLDVVNGGGRATPTVEGIEFRGREITTESGTLQVIPIGPESALTIVGSPEIAADATLVPANQLSDAGFAQIGQTELRLSQINDDTSTKYVVLAQESWQPVINEEVLDQFAFAAQRAQLGERRLQLVGNVEMQVTQYTATDKEPVDIVILVSGTNDSLVIPVSQAQGLRLAQGGGLITARGDTYNRIPYRVQDGFEEGEETHSVALVGDLRDMALVVPQSSVTQAFDVNPDHLARAMHPHLSTSGYTEALQTKVGETYFPTFFRNSFVLVLMNTIGHLLSCIVVAYAFARLRAPGKNFLFIILLSTMMLPFPVTLVPVYELFTKFNMVNTLWPLFIRSFFGNAFLIFMLRQFFSSIPRELEDAAKIDGANVGQVIWNVIVPLSKPAIATVAIFTFWWTWNSFLEPFIYLSSPELFPVSVGLNFFQDQYAAVYYDRLIAASVMSMVPMIVIFFFAQRYFIEGIQLTGMKG